MDFIIPMVWLAAFIIFLLYEIVTLGLTSIWFAGGALAAFIVALCKGNLFIQIFVFLIVSFALLFTLRPFASKYFNKSRQKTNLDAIIGRQAVVIKEIDNLKGTGEISLSGQIWTARSEDDNVIEEHAKVEIVLIEGVKAIVKKL